MKTYLIVEDDEIKRRAYQSFATHYQDSGIVFVTKLSAADAITTLQDPDERAEIDGVIADFYLSDWPDTPYKRIRLPAPDGGEYTASTGMGVLDWVHAVAPELPLWALTNDSAAHAPLFMSAASLWLDAKPLHVDRLTLAGSPLGDRMRDEFLQPQRYAALNPLWPRIEESRLAFGELLDISYGGVEAFDWLNALTHLEGAPGGFAPTLKNRIRQITLNARVNVFANTLSQNMARWQLRLDEVYRDFPVSREESRWPPIDEDRLPIALSTWAEFNPITGFLGADGRCRDFFAVEDVRMALMRWHARGQTP